MASQIYLFDNEVDLNKVKTVIINKLKTIDAVKFNDTYNVSIEGWDVLTFVYMGMDDIKSHFIENAPYEHIIIINSQQHLSNDVDQICGDILNYTLTAIDIDCDNITDDILYALLSGTTNDYEKILKGEVELVDDYQMSSDDVERLKVALESKPCIEKHDDTRKIRIVFHVYNNSSDLRISKKSFDIAYSDFGLHVIYYRNRIIIDSDIEHRFYLLSELESNLVGNRLNKIYFYNIDENDIGEELMANINSRIIR